MAIANSVQRDALLSMGWTNDAISTMGQALLEDIYADFSRGILRPPSTILHEPEDVAIDVFLTGVQTDIVNAADALRDAGKDILDMSPLIVAGVALLAVFLLLGR